MTAIAVGSVIGSDFRIERALAEGGMGAVYVVEQLSTGKKRALKVLHAALVEDARNRQRFVEEARISAHIDSEHVVEVIGAGIDEASGAPWIAMELLSGQHLEEYVSERGPLGLPEIAVLFGQLGHALERAHAQGIIHRDLKPENLFVTTPARVGAPPTLKILDFGIAKLVEGNKTAATVTSAIGSPMWLAPEQARTGAKLRPSADVWALGLIAFYLATGKSYWWSANLSQVSLQALLAEILVTPLPTASERARQLGAPPLPPAFDAWFAKCVEREPSARFQDAGAAVRALSTEVGSNVPSTRPVAPIAATQPMPQDRSPVVVQRTPVPTPSTPTPVTPSTPIPVTPTNTANTPGPRRVWVYVLAAIVLFVPLAGFGVWAAASAFSDPWTDETTHEPLTWLVPVGIDGEGPLPRPRIEVRSDGLATIDAEGTRTRGGPDGVDIASAVQRGQSTHVAVEEGIPSGRAWPVIESVLADAARPVALVARGERGAVIFLVGSAPAAGLRGERELGLGVAITENGFRVYGTGGNLAPGCENVSIDPRVVSVPVRRLDARERRAARERRERREVDDLRECLVRVKAAFPDDRTIAFSADSEVPFDRVLQAMEAASSGSEPLFDDLRLGWMPAERAGPLPPSVNDLLGALHSPQEEVVERVVRGRVTLGTVESTGGPGRFDAATVTSMLRSRQSAIRRCYETELRSDPTMAGGVEVRFTVMPTGTVSQTTATPSGTASPALASCLTRVVARFRFNPGADGGGASFVVPLTFAPAD